MGTPEYSIPALQMLIENRYEIKAVITQQDKEQGRGKKIKPPPVKKEAELHHIPVLQPASLKTADFEEKIMKLEPDLFITIAYGKIIPENILDIPGYGCINVHASLLPKYRGPAPIWRALIDGEKKTGVTTMYTDKGVDTGDILLKRELTIDDDMTAGQLHDRLALLSAEALKETLELLWEGKLQPKKQDERLATYAPSITKETGKIDWQKDPEAIRNLVRGLCPYPGAYSFYQGVCMKILSARAENINANARPGKIIEVGKDSFAVACKKGILRVYRIQMPGKKAMDVSDYLNGNDISEGEILGQDI